MTTAKATKTAPLITYYVFHGDDEFTRKNELAALEKRMGDSPEAQMNSVHLDGTHTSVSQVLAAARSLPFLSDKRLVIVEGMLSWLTRKGAGKDAKSDLESLIVALPTLPDWARVILHEPGKLPATHPIFKLMNADSRGFEREFKPLDAKAAAAWVARRVAAEDGSIEPAAAARLVELVGSDLRALESEVVKLVLYTNNARSIGMDDVAELVAGSPEAKIWELVDLFGDTRNGRAALNILHTLLDMRQEPLGILGMVNRQFRLLIQVKEFLDGGGAGSELGRLLNLSDYPLRLFMNQSKRFSLVQLETIHRRLLDIDYQIKTGQINDLLALDTLIAELTS